MKTTLEFVVKVGLTFAIAAALLVPSSIKVQSAAIADDGFKLQSVEQTSSIPWIAVKPKPPTFKIDTLLAPLYEQPQLAFARRIPNTIIALR